jgi:hypothetical protein
MLETKSLPAKANTFSDAVIDGLIGGVISGIIMLALILIVEYSSGTRPEVVLGWFEPSDMTSPILGGLIHIAVSAIYGMIFGWLWHILRYVLDLKVSGWLAGFLFGLALFMIGGWVILPGIDSALLAIPTWLLGLAHAIYGLLLGWLVGRKSRAA